MTTSREQVLEKLRASPLFAKVVADLSESDRAQLEAVVETFVSDLSETLNAAASDPEELSRAAKSSGSDG